MEELFSVKHDHDHGCDILLRYKCGQCGQTFISVELLDTHIHSHNQKSLLPYVCAICTAACSNKGTLESHIMVHICVPKYECEKCKKLFQEESNLKKHFDFHKENPFQCEKCLKYFALAIEVKKHFCHTKKMYELEINSNKSISSKKRVQCDKCFKWCSDRQWRYHLNGDGKGPHNCSICREVVSSSKCLTDHMTAHFYPKYHRCELCMTDFENISELSLHIRNKHRKIKVEHKCEKCFQGYPTLNGLFAHECSKEKCSVCGKVLAIASLRFHMRKHTDEEPYLCETCGKTFKDMTSLNNHRRRHVLTCDLCSISFTNTLRLNTHKRNCHNLKNTYDCEICNKSLVRKASIKNHMRIHTGENLQECKICNKIFSNESDLRIHMKIHARRNPYICNICSKSFRNILQLKKHERLHFKKRQDYLCEICGFRFRLEKTFFIHKRVHSGLKHNECEKCGMHFITTVSLNSHMYRSHGITMQYDCDVCGKTCKRLEDLKRHMSIHSPYRQYECKICNARFKVKYYLRKHLRTHAVNQSLRSGIFAKGVIDTSLNRQKHTHIEVYSNECKICWKMFKYEKSLEKHKEKPCGVKAMLDSSILKYTDPKENVWILSSERPFQCDICTRAFKTKGDMKNHKPTHFKDRPYKCDICHKSFKVFKYLQDHRRYHSDLRPFTCNICQKNFISASALRKHQKGHNNDKKSLETVLNST